MEACFRLRVKISQDICDMSYTEYKLQLQDTKSYYETESQSRETEL